MKSADGEEQGAEKKGARRERKPATYFYKKEGAQGTPGAVSRLLRSSQETAGGRQWSRGEGTQ